MTPGAAARPDHVLHVGSAPFTRAKLGALRLAGVEVTHVRPADLEAAFEDPQQVAAMTQRLREAEVCLLDEGTGPRLAGVVFVIRSAQHRTLATIESIAQAGLGMAHGQRLVGGAAIECEFVPPRALFQTLCGLGRPTRVTPPPAAGVCGTRPPTPMTFFDHETACTERELRRVPKEYLGAVRRLRGLDRPSELLAPGAAARFQEMDPADILCYLFIHLATDELRLLGGQGAGEWWNRLVTTLEGRQPLPWGWLADLGEDRPAVEAVLWQAMIRDHGRETLSAMPPALVQLHLQVVRQWPRALAAVARRMPRELVDPMACEERESFGESFLKHWDVVPGEDPLDPEADPNLFHPTLTTLRIARRYRSVPEVLIGARGRWGSRPYLEKLTGEQLVTFVRESPPTSAQQLEEWIRLLRTLPKSRMRECVIGGMMNGWPQVPAELADTWLPEEDVRDVAAKIPCYDLNGVLLDDVVNRITQERIRDLLHLRERKLESRFGRSNKHEG